MSWVDDNLGEEDTSTQEEKDSKCPITGGKCPDSNCGKC